MLVFCFSCNSLLDVSDLSKKFTWFGLYFFDFGDKHSEVLNDLIRSLSLIVFCDFICWCNEFSTD